MRTETIVYIYNMLKENADQAIAKKEKLTVEYNRKRKEYFDKNADGTGWDSALSDFLEPVKTDCRNARVEAEKALEALADFEAAEW